MLLLSSHSRLIAFNCHPSSTCFHAQLQFCFAELHKQKGGDVLTRWAFFVEMSHIRPFVHRRKKKGHMSSTQSMKEQGVVSFSLCQNAAIRCCESQNKLSVHFQGIPCPRPGVSSGQHETRTRCTFPSYVVLSMSNYVSSPPFSSG